MKTQELTISGEMFEELRTNIDVAMRILINRMITAKINKGSVSAKIAITMKEFIDDNGEIVRMPEIDYNIGMGMSEKDSMKGNIQRGLFLQRCAEGRLMVGSQQVSMEELMTAQEEAEA